MSAPQTKTDDPKTGARTLLPTISRPIRAAPDEKTTKYSRNTARILLEDDGQLRPSRFVGTTFYCATVRPGGVAERPIDNLPPAILGIIYSVHFQVLVHKPGPAENIQENPV